MSDPASPYYDDSKWSAEEHLNAAKGYRAQADELAGAKFEDWAKEVHPDLNPDQFEQSHRDQFTRTQAIRDQMAMDLRKKADFHEKRAKVKGA